MSEDFKFYVAKASLISAIMLFAGILPMPYGYYQLLRLVVAGTALALTFYFHKSNLRSYAILTGLAALIFNPMLPLAFGREGWAVLNLLFAGWFFFSYKKCKLTSNRA